MKYRYKEIKEEKKSLGCVLSRLFIRYPEDTGNEKLDLFFKSEADGFYKFITETAFKEKENAFSDYTEGGGRRSLFPLTDYKLDITVISKYQSFISVKTVALSAESNNVTAYKIFYEVFDTKTGALCREKDFLKRKPKEKHDGFYLKDGKIIFYSAQKNANQQLKIPEISRLFVTSAAFDIENIRFPTV